MNPNQNTLNPEWATYRKQVMEWLQYFSDENYRTEVHAIHFSHSPKSDKNYIMSLLVKLAAEFFLDDLDLDETASERIGEIFRNTQEVEVMKAVTKELYELISTVDPTSENKVYISSPHWEALSLEAKKAYQLFNQEE